MYFFRVSEFFTYYPQKFDSREKLYFIKDNRKKFKMRDLIYDYNKK